MGKDALLRDLERNNHLNGFGRMLAETGWPKAEIEGAISAENDSRCDPPLDAALVASIAKAALLHAQTPAHEPDPADLLAAVRSLPFLDQLMALGRLGVAGLGLLISLLNERHAVVSEAGRTIVITETVDPVLQRRVLLRSSFQDLRNAYMAVQVCIGKKPDGRAECKPLGHLWLEDPGRRQYEGIVFAPGEDVSGHFNLWRGFAVEPVQGDWSRMARHIRDVLCRGDDRLFRYVMAWLAFRVQHPGKQAEAALVLRGARGSGKSVFGGQIGSLFGQHYIHISHPRHLTGNFNAHQQDAVVIFADEAFGAEGYAGEGVLKRLITEPTIAIERKGRDVFFVKNCSGLIIASNNDWVVPAGLDERRFCVLDVSDAWAQNHDYFRALIDQMNNGGREATLFDLMHFDLADVDLRDVPATTALQEHNYSRCGPSSDGGLRNCGMASC